MWRLLRDYGRPWLGWYAAGVAAVVATNAVSVQVPLVLARGIDALGRGDVAAARWQALGVTVLALLVVGIRTASRLCFFQPGRFVEAQLLRDLFRVVLEQDPPFFVAHPPGDVTSRVTSDLQNLRLLFGFALLGLVNTAAAVVVTGAQMLRMSWQITLLATIPLALAFAATTSAAGRMRDVSRRVQEATGALGDDALATFQGLATLRAYGAQGAAIHRFSRLNDAVARVTVERSNLRIWIGPVLALAAGVDTWLALALGGPSAIAGDLTTGDLVAFASLVGLVAWPLRGFTFTLAILRQAQASVDRVLQLLDARPLRPELPLPAPVPSEAPEIEIRGLTVRYGDTVALEDLDLVVPAGSVLGVYGPTGSGKTTLARALVRLVDPPPGAIRVDGTDVRSFDREAWRSVAALVPQRAFLFSESVARNVGFDRATPEAIALACRRAQLETDLAAFPEGLDTVVGEAGLTVSGGQRQRVALARGLVRPAVVRIFDDVLSAVDPATERALIEDWRDRADRPTTVLVSNRMSALVHADAILVLEGGRRVDLGTHTELLSRPGPYRDAWRAQEGG